MLQVSDEAQSLQNLYPGFKHTSIHKAKPRALKILQKESWGIYRYFIETVSSWTVQGNKDANCVNKNHIIRTITVH
mgnify:CR=1 FL=1